MFGFSLAMPANADVIYLRNGRTLEGEILGQTETYLEVRLKAVKAKFNIDDVEAIEKKDLPEGFFKEAKVDIKEPQKQAEGYSPPPKPSYAIKLKARYRDEFNREVIDIEAKTNLPEGILVNVYFKRSDDVIASLRTPVKNGKFFARLGPFESKLSSGKYTVEAESASGPDTKEAVKASYALPINVNR